MFIEKLGHTAAGHARVPSFQPLHFMVFEIGRIGVLGMLHDRVNLCLLLSCSCMKAHAHVKLTGLPMVSKHRCVIRPCYFGSFAHGHVARPWKLIASRVGEENFSLFSHDRRHTHVPGRVCFRKPAFHESVSMLDVKTKI